MSWSKDEIIEMMNGCACFTVTTSSHGITHLEKSCRLEVEDCGGGGNIVTAISGSTKTLVISLVQASVQTVAPSDLPEVV